MTARFDIESISAQDGADLCLHYNGSLESEVAMTALFGDGETSLGDNYWCTHVRLESGAERDQWVNRTMFVGRGRAVTTASSTRSTASPDRG